MENTEISRAPKLAKLSLLFVLMAILIAFVETNISPLKEVYQRSAGYRLQCIISWLVGAGGGVYFAIASLRQRQPGDRRSLAFSIIGLLLGGAILALFLGGTVVGMLSR